MKLAKSGAWGNGEGLSGEECSGLWAWNLPRGLVGLGQGPQWAPRALLAIFRVAPVLLEVTW